jgi:hypothetical protein
MNRLFCLIAISMTVFVTAGCSKKVDENKPLEQVRAEAGKMSVDDLRKMCIKYKTAIAEREEQISTEGAKVKEVPVSQVLRGVDNDSDKIKRKITELASSEKALVERFLIYADEYQKKGGKLSDLERK